MNDPQSLPPEPLQGQAAKLRREGSSRALGRFVDHLFKGAGEYDALADACDPGSVG